MTNVFFTADQHFGHANILRYEPVFRPFATIEEHDEALIERWNDVVRDDDIVWCLGDFMLPSAPHTMGAICSRLRGRKRLVMGNHDGRPMEQYAKHFERVTGAFHWHGVLLSHVPVHPSSLEPRFTHNYHGHLHSRRVLDADGKPNPTYICMSVEHWDLRPVAADEIHRS